MRLAIVPNPLAGIALVAAVLASACGGEADDALTGRPGEEPASDVPAEDPIAAAPSTDGALTPERSDDVVPEADKRARTGLPSVIDAAARPFRIIDANSVKLPARDWGYAYGASIVRADRPGGGVRYHAFVCSTGVEGGTHDKIRYTSSDDDGKTWSAPVVKVSATGGGDSLDFSACDPSVVRFGDYWYLYYSGLRKIPLAGCNAPYNGVPQTVVRVARSRTIDGVYEKAITADGKLSWVPAAAELPANNPHVVVGPRHVVCGNYGAGQQSVVVRDGVIWMWYLDDTAKPDGSPATARNGQIWLVKSTDPLKFDFYRSTPNVGGFVALDVKYDARADAFIQVAVPWVATSGPSGGLSALPSRYSRDGITWSEGRSIAGVGQMPRWSRVEAGLSADESGHLQTGTTLFGFGCPHGHCTKLGSAGPATKPANGYWDMWGYAVTDLSSQLFEP